MAFRNKYVNEKIKILNETLLNILNNFIHNKISKFGYKTRMDEQGDYITFEETIETY